ncbi:MAG TPA: hypothetical protein VJQ09_06390, partial [Candidatus Limnocylindria bacterium]|nr:hypothetical protein [Candidatus Limnocylindria bacterium]
PTRTPTPPTPAPTVAPTPVPTDDYGNTPATAASVVPGTAYTGVIEIPSDVDWFRMSVQSNVLITVDFKGFTLSSGAIALYYGTATNPTPISEEVDTGSGARIVHLTTQAGTYYLRVRSTRGDTGTYSFAFSLTAR